MSKTLGVIPVVEESTLSQPSTKPQSQSKTKLASVKARRSWFFPLLHVVLCLVLSLMLILVINGYEAIDTSTPRHQNGKYLLRVSDITTLVSMGLVFIKFTVTSWSILTLWRCADLLKTHPGLPIPRFAFMMRWRAPPFMMWPPEIPQGKKSWVVGIVLLLILPQPFIAPLLSGSVDWNSSLVSGAEVKVMSGSPNPEPEDWYYYVYQGPDRTAQLRRAAGAISLTWDVGNGAKSTGNGCRHIVNDDGLPINSTLKDALIPCLVVHSIQWDTSAGSKDVETATSKTGAVEYSIVSDNEGPFDLYQSGLAMVIDFNQTRGASTGLYTYNDTLATASHLPSLLFQGTKEILLMVTHQNQTGCSPLEPNIFGDLSQFKNTYSHETSTTDESCFTAGKITFTAGVIKSAVNTYITSRVVESQDDKNNLDWQSDVYTQEALWMLPDLMSVAALANSSGLATWDNLDGYVETLVRSSYLAAWDTLTRVYGLGGPGSVELTATTVVPRLKATVSYARVFAWLGINLLATMSAMLLWWIYRSTKYTSVASEEVDEQLDEAQEGAVEDGRGEASDELKDIVGIDNLIGMF